jgi:rod shape-determining protein MreC
MPLLKPRGRMLVLAAIGLTASLLLLLPERLSNKAQSAFGAPLAMALKAPATVSGQLRRSWSTLLDWFRLGEENRSLKEELVRLRVEEQQLRQSNASLGRNGRELHINRRYLFHLVPAGLLGRDPSTWFNYVTLDRGASDGVPEGAGVVAYEGVVGKVAAVGPLSCKVVFLVDPSCRISVRDARNHVAATLAGAGRDACRLLYLSGQDDVRPGDPIETAGEGSIFSSGIPVGVVTRVEKRDNGLNLFAEVRPAVRLSLLEDFFILQGGTGQ